jgi:hypothetical protein
MGGDYYAEAFNNLSDSDEFDDKIGDWDVHLESDNNRIYAKDGNIFQSRKNTRQKKSRDQYQSFYEDQDESISGKPSKDFGVDFRLQNEQNIRESYEESFGN